MALAAIVRKMTRGSSIDPIVAAAVAAAVQARKKDKVDKSQEAWKRFGGDELEAALAKEKAWREEREQRQPDGESHGSARQLAAAKLVRLRGKSFNRQQAASLR